ncbi:MAG: hypothetical protein ACYDB7_02495 [Mycobacteriales bacterium]
MHTCDGQMYLFDFDGAAEHWRAWVPQGVFHYSVLSGRPWWDCWLAGYRTVRAMAADNQVAVPYFVLMFQFENAAWNLGLTPTSVGALLRPDDLGGVVNRWNAWAGAYCAEHK